ncbi:MAG: hypothetical protein ABFD89_20705, partial [Bryobacteraceae bacterium]
MRWICADRAHLAAERAAVRTDVVPRRTKGIAADAAFSAARDQASFEAAATTRSITRARGPEARSVASSWKEKRSSSRKTRAS